jgi:hypothetical protein
VHSDRARHGSIGRSTNLRVGVGYIFRFRAAHDGSLESIKKYFYTVMVVLDSVHFRVLPSSLKTKKNRNLPAALVFACRIRPLFEHLQLND